MTQRILVTGANKGIGLATVERILDEHDHTFVFLGSRDPERGEAARETLVASHPDWAPRIEVLEIDVGDDASVQEAAKSVAGRFEGEPTPLYAIVNNAGIGFGDTSLSEILNVNTYGPRRVCEAFIPLLDPKRGRIVIISSAAGPMFVAGCEPEQREFFLNESVSWEELDALMQSTLKLADSAAFAAKGLGSMNAYGLSKACVNTYMLLLARQYPDLKINSCTPGFIATDLTKTYADAQGKSPEQMGMKTPHEGASATMHLLFGDLAGNAWYYGSDAERSPMHRYRSPGDPPFTGEL